MHIPTLQTVIDVATNKQTKKKKAGIDWILTLEVSISALSGFISIVTCFLLIQVMVALLRMLVEQKLCLFLLLIYQHIFTRINIPVHWWTEKIF